MARITPDDPGVQSTMLWLLESYDATAVPLAGRTGLNAPVVPPVEPEPTHAPSWPALRAVAVLERAPEADPDVEPEIERDEAAPGSTPVLLFEQRLERRIDCAMAVAAANQSDTAETALGETVNISVSGVHLVMDRAAIVGPIELIVGDAVVAARVVDHRELSDGRHAWHVHVLDNDDDAWLELVGDALGPSS
jgi:hypothetical protein